MTHSTSLPVVEASISPERPVLIIGAGIVGLTLAQALQKAQIPFRIFDRDVSVNSRSNGWGLTFHWALEALKSCLPQHVIDRLPSAQVDPDQASRGNEPFLFVNLATAQARYSTPTSGGLRFNRHLFRLVLLEGLDVQWGKALESFKERADGVEVAFVDGTTAQGSLVVGIDGANSQMRRLLCPNTYPCNQLPVRFMGVTVRQSEAQIAPLRAISKVMFHGLHPETNTFMWFSIMSTPDVNGSSGSADGWYDVQTSLSWVVKSPEDEVPTSHADRLAKLKELAAPFHENLAALIQSIPHGTEVTSITIQDWPLVSWPAIGGRVTLAGDAAHAMTMFRGEAANHGVMDAVRLVQALQTVVQGQKTQASALDEYAADVRERTGDAVLLSRQACLDAHNWKGLTDGSPVVSKRAILASKT